MISSIKKNKWWKEKRVEWTNIRGLVDLDGERMYLVGRNQAQTNYEEDFVNSARKSGEKLFTVDEVADLTREETLSQIIREDQSYQRTVTVDFFGSAEAGNELHRVGAGNCTCSCGGVH